MREASARPSRSPPLRRRATVRVATGGTNRNGRRSTDLAGGCDMCASACPVRVRGRRRRSVGAVHRGRDRRLSQSARAITDRAGVPVHRSRRRLVECGIRSRWCRDGRPQLSCCVLACDRCPHRRGAVQRGHLPRADRAADPSVDDDAGMVPAASNRDVSDVLRWMATCSTRSAAGRWTPRSGGDVS